MLHEKNSIQNCIYMMNSNIQIYKVNGALFLEMKSCFRGIKSLIIFISLFYTLFMSLTSTKMITNYLYDSKNGIEKEMELKKSN